MTVRPTPAPAKIARAEAALAEHAASKPEVVENRPWGHRAFKVKGKTFVFLSAGADGLSLSVKLPESRAAALALPFTEPTHYGLGKSGWVTANLGPNDAIPLPLLRGFIDESYRAIAPKRLLANLEDPPKQPRAATRKTAKKTPRRRGA